jgi:protein-arginine kinase activator protein McsA
MVAAPLKEVVRPAPYCQDCHLPASLRTVVSRSKPIRVYQCSNCAKVIWEE